MVEVELKYDKATNRMRGLANIFVMDYVEQLERVVTE